MSEYEEPRPLTEREAGVQEHLRIHRHYHEDGSTMEYCDPRHIPPPGFVAKLPPVGKVFTDPSNSPGPGWLWSDHADPPRWLPPDVSSPYFNQAIEDAHKAASSPLPHLPSAPDPQGQDRGQGEGDVPHKWDRDGERCLVCGAKDWMPGGCTKPSPLPQSHDAPDQTGQDRGQGEGDALLPNQCSHCGIIVEGMSMAVHTCYVCDVDAPPFRPVKSTTAPHQPAPAPQSVVAQGEGDRCKHGISRQYVCGACKYPEQGEGMPTLTRDDTEHGVEYVRREDAEREVAKWKANHDNQVRLKRALAERPDLQERAAAWKKIADENETLRAQLAAAQAQVSEHRKYLAAAQAENERLRKGITEIKAGARIGWFMTDLGAKCATLLNE